MIVVDTSALMAIALGESEAEACSIAQDADVLISAGTMAETMIVAGRRGVSNLLAGMIHLLGFEVVPVTEAGAMRAADAYAKWGKGARPASLNFGDCFAYEQARERACPLLFVGEDFARTDIEPAIPPGATAAPRSPS